jgi:hypothetical protein
LVIVAKPAADSGDAVAWVGKVGKVGNTTPLPTAFPSRAVGPGLTQFGIGDAIADPKIEIFHGTTKILENDNWNTRTDGLSRATIETASQGVSAFPIDAGSKDAVILSDFGAGTYSAQITGVNGATGTAIVEVYVVK